MSSEYFQRHSRVSNLIRHIFRQILSSATARRDCRQAMRALPNLFDDWQYKSYKKLIIGNDRFRSPAVSGADLASGRTLESRWSHVRVTVIAYKNWDTKRWTITRTLQIWATHRSLSPGRFPSPTMGGMVGEDWCTTSFFFRFFLKCNICGDCFVGVLPNALGLLFASNTARHSRDANLQISWRYIPPGSHAILQLGIDYAMLT